MPDTYKNYATSVDVTTITTATAATASYFEIIVPYLNIT